MEKMTTVVLSALEGLEELGPILNRGSGTSAGSPSGSQTGSQSRSFVSFVCRDGCGSGV